MYNVEMTNTIQSSSLWNIVSKSEYSVLILL